MTSSFCYPPVVDFSFVQQPFFASKGRAIQISGGICANLHTIEILVGGTMADYSSGLHES
jgi:hypothetical protein